MGKHIFEKFRNAEEIKEINDCSPQGAGFIQTKFMVNYKQQSRKLTSDSNTMQRMVGLEIEDWLGKENIYQRKEYQGKRKNLTVIVLDKTTTTIILSFIKATIFALACIINLTQTWNIW